MKLVLEQIDAKYFPISEHGERVEIPMLNFTVAGTQASTSRVDKCGEDLFQFPESIELEFSDIEGYETGELQLELRAYDYTHEDVHLIGSGMVSLLKIVPEAIFESAEYNQHRLSNSSSFTFKPIARPNKGGLDASTSIGLDSGEDSEKKSVPIDANYNRKGNAIDGYTFDLTLDSFDPKFDGPWGDCKFSMRGILTKPDPMKEELLSKAKELDAVKCSYADYIASSKSLEDEMETTLLKARAVIDKLKAKSRGQKQKIEEITSERDAVADELGSLRSRVKSILPEQVARSVLHGGAVDDAAIDLMMLSIDSASKPSSLTATSGSFTKGLASGQTSRATSGSPGEVKLSPASQSQATTATVVQSYATPNRRGSAPGSLERPQTILEPHLAPASADALAAAAAAMPSHPPIECSISCTVPLRPVTTPCGHTFDMQALADWRSSRRSNMCPVCRAPLPDPKGQQPLSVNVSMLAMVGSWYALHKRLIMSEAKVRDLQLLLSPQSNGQDASTHG